MQKVIGDLLKLGPLPSEESSFEVIEEYEALILKITTPLTQEEATALVALLGNDSCYGLAWTVLHAIETAPAYHIDSSLKDREFVQTAATRLANKI